MGDEKWRRGGKFARTEQAVGKVVVNTDGKTETIAENSAPGVSRRLLRQLVAPWKKFDRVPHCCLSCGIGIGDVKYVIDVQA